MKTILLLSFLICFALSGKSQVLSGTLLESGRVLLGKPSFTIDSKTEGTVVIEVAVNRQGIVTGCKVIGEGTTIKSTPSVMIAQNASKKLTFTVGTRYAEFEHVRIKYTYKKAPVTTP